MARSTFLLLLDFISDQHIIPNYNVNLQDVQMRGVVMAVFVKVANEKC